MEKKYKVISVKQSVFALNGEKADNTRRYLKEKKVFLLNLMASPGAGKTTLLKKTINALKDEMKIGIIEADIEGTCDADTIAESGVKTIQLHTNGLCHLDADMTRVGVDELGIDGLDLVVLENIGNLVCPAEFDTGAVKNAMLLSVPEGEDKPLKYPLMFAVSSLILISKMDTAPFFGFDLEKCEENIRLRNDSAEIIPFSAKTGEGFDLFLTWLRKEVKDWKNS